MKLIDKDVLVVEIEKWISGWTGRLNTNPSNPSFFEGGIEMGKHILSFINSLTECQQVSPVDGDELGKEVERLYSIYHFNAPIGETRFIAKYFANWKLEKALGIADKAYFESCAKIRQQTIDKAAEWLSELDDALFLGYDNDGYPYIDRDGLARDFKKYMED